MAGGGLDLGGGCAFLVCTVATHMDASDHVIICGEVAGGEVFLEAPTEANHRKTVGLDFRQLGTYYLDSVTPDVIACNASVSACAEGAKTERALELFAVLQKQWLTPNVITYSASVSTCKKGVQAERALGLFEALLKNSMTPDVITYNASISACGKGVKAESVGAC